MSTRNLIFLLFPTLVFVVIAAAAFQLSQKDFRYYDPAKDRESQQKLDTFVADVQSGKWLLTTDKWLEAIRRERKVTEAERRIGMDSAIVIRQGGWLILWGVTCQVLVVLTVKKQMKAVMPNTARGRVKTSAAGE